MRLHGTPFQVAPASGQTIAIALPSHIIMIGLPISMIIGWRLKNA